MNHNLKWEILNKLKNKKTEKLKNSEIVNIILENRGIKTKKEKEEFFKPIPPEKIAIKSLSLTQKEVSKTISRIKKAIKNEEEIIIYGDYDTDGVCATAILWEKLYSFTKNVRPYIPSRFEEGYGLNAESIRNLKLKIKNLKLIITVDNGIVAYEAVDKANELGIDVIITDHHHKENKLPNAYAIIHTAKICGSGIAWILARELTKKLKNDKNISGLDLTAVGTIADQMPLIGSNRSFAKYGLKALNSTKRLGLLALFEEAGLSVFKGVGMYEVNFIIAPRINAMGRLEHAIDSLRLLCTTNAFRAKELAATLGRVNRERQKIVDDVVTHAYASIDLEKSGGLIILGNESYHEGVIGLAASKLVEKFYRPAIVLSKGESVSKASARSIPGFDIIEAIRSAHKLIIGGGGHPMAAGFSIETVNIDKFNRLINKKSKHLLTDEILSKTLKVDVELEFKQLNTQFYNELYKFEPTGIGNPTPVFVTYKVKVIGVRIIGSDGKHLKLRLEKDGKIIDAIAFGMGEIYTRLSTESTMDVAYNLTTDSWNGNKSLQLKIKDIHLGN